MGWKRTKFSNLETEDLVEQPPSLKIMSPSGIDKKHIFRDIILCIIFLIIGILIGWFSRSTDHGKKSHDMDTTTTSPDHSNQYDPIEKILANLDKQRIKSNLRDYTLKPRLTGTAGEKELVEKIFKTWKENGLTDVVITPYKILMSYPNITQPNKVEIRFNNQTVFTSHFYEKTLRKEDDSSKLVPPYNSFAPSGIAEGPLIYVNYGRIEDFQYLHKNHSVNFKGSVVIARYGKIFRGDKLKIAAQYNASGMILYTDPADFNIGENQTYPDTWWLPEQAVQRGTVGSDGDYLTPLYPATEDAYRISLAEAKKLLPKIPCQPIGYGDAQVLLSEMAGDVAPSDWQGKLPITYKIGPGHLNTSLIVRLQVNNYETITTTWNVIGYIKGKLEPDRYVILGNHHDSWVYSAVDPLSGAASLTEITRVLGNMSKEGWQPRRTIVFCSWGGEEQGLIGSTEWVEEHMKELYERGVAYLNVDYALDFYDKLSINTSPLLQDVTYKSAKKVTKKTVVCSKHFRPEDYKFTPVKRILKPGTVPSIFPWSIARTVRKAPLKRLPLQPKSQVHDNQLSGHDQNIDIVAVDEHGVQDAETQTAPCSSTNDLLARIRQLEEEKNQLQHEIVLERFGIARFSSDPSMMS